MRVVNVLNPLHQRTVKITAALFVALILEQPTEKIFSIKAVRESDNPTHQFPTGANQNHSPAEAGEDSHLERGFCGLRHKREKTEMLWEAYCL